MRRWLVYLLVIALLSHLAFIFMSVDVWWDGGVYLGMGKFLFSLGQHGLWEHIRPPLLPLFLGFFWLLGLDPIIFGKVLELAFMVGGVYLIYSLGRSWFDSERAGLVAGLLLCFSPIFFFLSFHLYTEIPAVFFILLSLWFFEKRWFLLSGSSIACAFMMKFPAGIFLPVLALFLVKRWRSLLLFGAGFSLVVAPYFIASYVVYGSPLSTLAAASDAISRALGCNVLRYRPWYHYFSLLVFTEIPFNALSLIGIYALFLKKIKARWLILACLFIPLAYFMNLHCRDYRYLALFYPFVALLAGYGFAWLFRGVNHRFFAIVVIVLTVWFASVGVRFYLAESHPPVALEYFGYLAGHEVTGEVWVSNPIIAAYTDVLLHKMYYPIYDEGVSKQFVDYVRDHSDRVGYVFLDNCGGGLMCAVDDLVCQDYTGELYLLLDERFDRVLDIEDGGCWYRVWST